MPCAVVTACDIPDKTGINLKFTNHKSPIMRKSSPALSKIPLPDPEPGWSRLSSSSLVGTPWLHVEEVEFATPARPQGGVAWTVVRRKSAVVVAPRLADGRFLLVHQERAPVERTLWEFPAGQIDEPEGGADVMESTARRELAEECAHQLVPGSGRLEALGYFFPSVGFTDECCHLFLAAPVEPIPHAPALGEGDECIHETRAITPDELRAWVADGRIRDANTLAAFARMCARGLL